MRSLGITEEALEAMCGGGESHPLIHRVWPFGSRALGTHKPGSDLDLALDAPIRPSAELGRVAEELDDLLLPWKWDFLELNRIDLPEVREDIFRVGLFLYNRSASEACHE